MHILISFVNWEIFNVAPLSKEYMVYVEIICRSWFSGELDWFQIPRNREKSGVICLKIYTKNFTGPGRWLSLDDTIRIWCALFVKKVWVSLTIPEWTMYVIRLNNGPSCQIRPKHFTMSRKRTLQIPLKLQWRKIFTQSLRACYSQVSSALKSKWKSGMKLKLLSFRFWLKLHIPLSFIHNRENWSVCDFGGREDPFPVLVIE